MFNLKGSEIVFLLLIALVVLGPEKLPDAIKRFGRAYGEFRRMSSGFQGELRAALDEPMRELRGTADALRQAAQFDVDPPMLDTSQGPGTPTTPTSSAPAPSTGLDFGDVAARRRERAAARGSDPMTDPGGGVPADDGGSAPAVSDPSGSAVDEAAS